MQLVTFREKNCLKVIWAEWCKLTITEKSCVILKHRTRNDQVAVVLLLKQDLADFLENPHVARQGEARKGALCKHRF